MKKLLLLLTALLTLGAGGAWAETLTLVTSQDYWNGGSFYRTSGVATSNWGHTYLSPASTTQPQVFINSNNAAEASGGFNCANGRHAAGKTFYLNIQPGYKITGYSITFKSVSTSTTITAADGTTSATADGSTTKTLSVTGLSTLKTSYSVAGANAILTSYTVTYEAVPGQKYRMFQKWNNVTNYAAYAKSDDVTHMFETNSTTGITLLANTYYLWAAYNDNCKLLLQNLGTARYVGTFTGTSSGSYALMTAENTSGAERLQLACNYNYGNFYTLQATSNNAYIDSYGSGDNSYINVHNALHQGDIFTFTPVKTVNFVNESSSAQAITVTASDETSGSYSTIYVATDGTDNITLSSSYLYSFDGGTNYVSSSEAATTITAAGSTDMTVMTKENAEVTVTYHIYYGGTEVATSDAIQNYSGDTPVVPTSLLRAYCSYQYYTTSSLDVVLPKVTKETTDIYVGCTLSGCPFVFSTEGSPIYYLLSGPSHNSSYTVRYLYAEGTNVKGATTPSKEDAYQWAFIGTPYGYVIKNKAGNYITSEAEIGATGANFNLYQNTIGINNSITHFSAAIFNGNNQTVLNDQNMGETINCYTSSTGAVKLTDGVKINNLTWAYFTPYAVANHAVLTYHYMFNGNEVGTLGPTIETTGATPSDFNMGFTSYVPSPATIEENTTSVTITATWSGPFDISDNYASATWYSLRLHNSSYAYPTYASESTPNVASPESYSASDHNAQWAFVGDPFYGLTIYNRSAGDSKVLETNAVAGDGGSTYATIETPGTKAYNKWFVKNASAYQPNGFYIENYQGYALNKRSTANLAYWTDRDGGSSFLAIKVPEDFTDAVDSDIQPYIDNAGDGYFKLPTSAASALSDAITAAKSDAVVTESEYNELIYSLNIAIARPATGYYLLKSYYDKYMYTDNGVIYGNKDSYDASSIVRLERDGNNYSIAIQGKYVQTPKQSESVALNTSPSAFSVTIVSPGRISLGQLARYSYLHTSSSQDYKVVGWAVGSDSPASLWTLEDVTSISVNLNSDGAATPTYYATFCAPFSYTVSGATAYTLAENGEYLVPTPVDGEVVAGTPVLLKGTAPTATLTIGTDYAETPGTSGLTGTYLAKTINGAADYVLGKNDAGVVGFYHWDNNKLSANRAYLASTSGVKGFAINWDGETDGISAVDNGQPAKGETIYTLSGQRVSKPTRGLYIVNGKKVVIK